MERVRAKSVGARNAKTMTAMTARASALRRAAPSALGAAYACAVALCGMMIVWIARAPGSCAPAYLSAMKDASFREASDRAVPRTLLTKYRRNFAVCATHVLPASVWCAIAPFQIHPTARKRFPKAHRIAGRVFFALSAAMTYGYGVIHARDLHFHANDFPSLKREENMSFWFDYGKIPGLSFVRIEHLGAAWFAFTACAAYAAVAFPPRNFAAHRAWTWRHIAAGLSVALQRVFIALHHVYFNAAYGFGHAHGVPELQKPIFADSLIFGVVVAVVACESCVALARPPRDRAKTS